MENPVGDKAVSVFLISQRLSLTLEPLDLKHLTDFKESPFGNDYPHWMNDAIINQYTSHAVYPLSSAQCEEYIRTCQSERRMVLAIIQSYSIDGSPGSYWRHIGNIALQQINHINRSAELALIIGKAGCQKKGYGLEAARLLCAHAFKQLGLNRIYCGTHQHNLGMQKLAVKLGMREEGRSRQAMFKNGEFADTVHYGMLRGEFIAS